MKLDYNPVYTGPGIKLLDICTKPNVDASKAFHLFDHGIMFGILCDEGPFLRLFGGSIVHGRCVISWNLCSNGVCLGSVLHVTCFVFGWLLLRLSLSQCGSGCYWKSQFIAT